MLTEDLLNFGTNQTLATTSAGRKDLVQSPIYQPRLEEIIVVVLVVTMWVVAVLIFLRRWASIRSLQPIEPRFLHNPKNLEQVKIVKRSKDSVLFKNHNKKLSVTIVEREKRRLQRMHTIAALPTVEMGHFGDEHRKEEVNVTHR